MPHIKVNFPRTAEDFVTGNGEGCWVIVEEDLKALHDDGYDGGSFEGVLDNDSWYYSSLKSGHKVLFTMKGENRPVALHEGFLEFHEPISDEGLQNLLNEIKANSGA